MHCERIIEVASWVSILASEESLAGRTVMEFWDPAHPRGLLGPAFASMLLSLGPDCSQRSDLVVVGDSFR